MFTLLLFLCSILVSATEFDNQVWSNIEASKSNVTAVKHTQAPSWVPESEFRGSFSILQSCVLTLVICVYSALHLNVPKQRDWLSLVRFKTKWCVIAIIAPEIVLGIALPSSFSAKASNSQRAKRVPNWA